MGLQAYVCQIQNQVKYCCVKYILVHEECGPWNCIISRQYRADRKFLHTLNPEVVRKPVYNPKTYIM